MHEAPQPQPPLLGSWQDLGSLEAIAAGVRAGTIDPVALADRAIERANAVQELNAVVYLDAERVRADAARATDGPLAGIPVLVKEIIEVEGMPFTCGSAVFAGRRADRDADIVRRLRNAGAVVLGLSHSHEFAYGPTGQSNVTGPSHNPHDPTRITGGSSAGSAAGVAAGITPLAIGTDTAGSVRIPAALCGIVGAMPTRQRLPRDGVFPLSSTLDHLGLFAHSVEDARYALASLTHDDFGGGAIDQPLLGIPTNPQLQDSTDEVAAAFDHARTRFPKTVNLELPDWPDLLATGFDLQGPEAAAVHADTFPARADEYQPDVKIRLTDAFAVPGWRYVRAKAHAAEIARAADDVLRSVDAVIFPTLPITTPPASETHGTVPSGTYLVRDLLIRNNRLANLTDHPCVTIPLPSKGLPIGLAILAADDSKALSVAAWIENRLRA
ncbi:amidase [Tenggerimyces flavus]|uniref:Amidase n=1 Tax=Tenggerimyces flavus TaxID=1708749 RepID=A0ABV7Y9L7_9ACTN|nr:amidase [Tenggerimyces flavus]MBM7785498.1 aspartyl-tRNA(Asn)/glutamyl-tRNA(Gln) amidotransferase subunit A [Tenggerimyces flavus]